MKKGQNHILIPAFLAIFLMLNLKDMRKIQDLTGKVIGKLTVIRKSPEKKYNQTTWECLCSCGNTTLVVTGSLNTGRIAGCIKCKSNATHGLSRSKEYHAWQRIKVRCYHKNREEYKSYGGRGITVCKRWLNSFENFYADMGDCPSNSHSIDRIDVNGNYEPSNCRWATLKEQCNNKRTNHFLEFNGESKTIQQWCDFFGLADTTVHNRLKRGWSIEDTLTKPVKV